MNLSAFRAYDIRGQYPDGVNEELAYLVGRALVRYLSAKTIVVGRDMRASSPSLSEKLIEGIICEGADVINIGMCTTPMLNYAVSAYEYDGGIMVSASHSPGDTNAFKLIGREESQLDEEKGLPQIKNLVEKGFTECPGKGAVTEKDVLSDYLALVMKPAEGLCSLKVVVDYGNGVGAISAKPALARLDLDLTELYEEPDGEFPNHPANPHDIENFSDLVAEVHEKKADLGIFFDGDADRALFVDDLGRIVPTDLLVVLLAQEELKEKANEKIYYDLRFSKAVPNLIKKAGGEPIMMRVGNPFYKRALKKDGGILGAEFSGHIMFAENYAIDDGLFATLKTLKMLCVRGKKLSDLIDSVKKYEGSPEESIEAKNPATVGERLSLEFPEAKPIALDGTYLDFPDGFISVRQSQTEAQLFRIRGEAKKREILEDRMDKVRNIVRG
jgi:phosphomannomutase